MKRNTGFDFSFSFTKASGISAEDIYNWQLGNPAAINEYADAANKNRFENSMLNLAITPKYQFNESLALSEHFSYNLVNTNEMFYIPINGTPKYYVSSIGDINGMDNEVRSMAGKQNSVMSDTRLDWKHRYDAHYIHLFGGARINWETYKMTSQLGYNTGNDKTPNMSNSLQFKKTGGADDKWKEIAWYGVAGYNYAERFYLDGGFSLQSSSRFGDDVEIRGARRCNSTSITLPARKTGPSTHFCRTCGCVAT